MILSDETRTELRADAQKARENFADRMVFVDGDHLLALLDEIDQLRAEAVQSRNAIDHYVGALGVERLNAHNEYQRAEKAEAAVDRVRTLAEEWANQPTDYDEDTEQQIEDGRSILAALDGDA